MTITGIEDGITHSIVVTLEIAENKKESALTSSVNPSSLKIGEQVSVGGAISPALSTAIKLVYIRPDGFEMAKHLQIPASGVFSDIYKPDTSGLWWVKARWSGNDR
ncbi:MAG: hypothetical protein ACP5K1_04185 [Candidatus Bathyarchaeia archaeon]